LVGAEQDTKFVEDLKTIQVRVVEGFYKDKVNYKQNRDQKHCLNLQIGMIIKKNSRDTKKKPPEYK
jgi:hypothetical protein